MNTVQLEKAMTGIPVFGGVFAANRIKIRQLPCYIIVNTDKHGLSGSHWVAMKLSESQCEFFDSLGNPPYFYHNHWHDLLIEIGGPYTYNKQRLQAHRTIFCGHYCIYFILQRILGISFVDILRKFDKINLSSNDAFVLHFVNTRSLVSF